MVSVCVVFMTVMFCLALIMKVYPVYLKGQQLKSYATELCRVAEVSGRVGTETTEKEKKLSETTGIDPEVEWSAAGRVQLNQEISVTCSLSMDIGLFGGFGSFPVTIHGRASGQSEVYWK